MAAIVFVLWRAISTERSGESHSEQSDDAVETLRKRYARGDIDEETYEKRARKLRER
ncbi:SHOCT domain-containing protein [Halanaeroarchaeum sulfurireducens]|nr:SHOCT domain-containing protein [Halanaeroarchaeum sulfurireducens]